MTTSVEQKVEDVKVTASGWVYPGAMQAAGCTPGLWGPHKAVGFVLQLSSLHVKMPCCTGSCLLFFWLNERAWCAAVRASTLFATTVHFQPLIFSVRCCLCGGYVFFSPVMCPCVWGEGKDHLLLWACPMGSSGMREEPVPEQLDSCVLPLCVLSGSGRVDGLLPSLHPEQMCLCLTLQIPLQKGKHSHK